VLRWRGGIDPEAFSIDSVNQQLQKKFGGMKKMPAKPVSTQPRAASRRAPE